MRRNRLAKPTAHPAAFSLCGSDRKNAAKKSNLVTLVGGFGITACGLICLSGGKDRSEEKSGTDQP